MKIIFWVEVFVFFVYSYQSLMKAEILSQTQRKVQFIRVLTALSKPDLSDSETNRLVASNILETVQIAFLATTISALFAFPLTFLSARSSSIWGRGLNFILQPISAVFRAVHPLISVIFIIVLTGIGNPKSGVIALTIFSTAVLFGKFSEYAWQHMSLKLSDLFKSHFLGLTLMHLPVNVLIASVIGFFDGGGIGFFLQQSIMLLDYNKAGTAIFACIITIGGMDLIFRAVWNRVLKYHFA